MLQNIRENIPFCHNKVKQKRKRKKEMPLDAYGLGKSVVICHPNTS